MHQMNFVNEAGGVARATSSELVFLQPPAGSVVSNAGLIEATDGGIIWIEGQNIVNQGQGTVQARSGSIIDLSNGTFHPDPALRIADADSVLSMSFGAIFENEGNVLSAGPGILRIGPGRVVIRGGTVTNGQGKLEFVEATLENATLAGTAAGGGVKIRGALTIDSTVTLTGSFGISADSDAVLQGAGISRFPDSVTFFVPGSTLEIAAEHRIEARALRLGGGTLLHKGVISSADVEIADKLTGNGTIISPEIEIRGGPFIFGDISPGVGIGKLTMVGDVEFHSSTSLTAELGTNDADLLAITGDLSLNFTENLVLSGGQAGSTYVIAEFSGRRIGVFDNVTPGYNVTYDDLAKQIRVEPIPEPASVALALVGMIAVGMWQWRKR
jgi:hypothetical protein